MGSAILTLGLCGFIRMYYMFNAGHKLDATVQVTKNILSRVKTKSNLSIAEMEDTELLIQGLSNTMPIRPLGAFSLDRSSALSTVGLVVTYLIVLLQFKTSE